MRRQANLDFDQAPPLGVVFGCLLPTPWLGVAAGLLLAFGPTAGLPHHFAPLSLALTHMLTVGMLLPVMLGALFQLFPVVAGVPVPAARYLAPGVAVWCISTSGLLATGFLGGPAPAFLLAASVGATGIGLIAVCLIVAGHRVVSVNATTATLRRIGFALLITLALGACLAAGLWGGWTLPWLPLLNLHIAWGAAGWLLALLSGVAATVLPMFWQTRRLPESWQRWQPWMLWVPLLLTSLPLVILNDGVRWLAFCLVRLVVMALAGGAVIALLGAGRRYDAGWPLWLLAAGSWLTASALGVLSLYLPAAWPLSWWQGVLVLVGGAVLPVNAMLGKIVPFLAWLHLRKRLPLRVRVPAMQTLLPPAIQRIQAGMVTAALVGLMLLPMSPERIALPVGLLFALSQLILAGMLMWVMSRYIKLVPRFGQVERISGA